MGYGGFNATTLNFSVHSVFSVVKFNLNTEGTEGTEDYHL
jgi:hypothetical protein